MRLFANHRTVSWTLPLTSAAFCWLIAPPNRLEWLVWMAFAPLFAWLVRGGILGRQALVGAGMVGGSYYLAISHPLLSLSWWGWGKATGYQFEEFVWHQKLLVLLIIMSLSAWGGMLWALCGWLTKRYATTPLRAVWLIHSLWVLLIEFFGHQTIFGMGWGLLGVHLHGAPVLRQFASAAGVAGLSFLILLVNAALGLWALEWRRMRALAASVPVRIRPALLSAVLVVAACAAYGAVVLGTSASPSASSSPMKVAVLQGNVLESSLEDFTPEGLDQTYAPMLRDALASEADIVVLPETVWLRTLQLDDSTSPWDSANQLVGREVMGRTLEDMVAGRSSLIIHGIDAVLRGQVYNTMAFWTSRGLAGTYFKRSIVPFAEFTPRGFGWLSPQNQLHGNGFTYHAGRTPALVTYHDVPIGSFICQEVMFADPIRESVRAGAHLLVTTGNDGVFVNPAVAETLHAMAQLRAVEHQRYLVRSMKTGVSSVIDPTGRVMALAPHDVRTVITATVVPSTSLSLYDRFGNWLVLLCGILAALIVWRGRRRSGDAQTDRHDHEESLRGLQAPRAPTFRLN